MSSLLVLSWVATLNDVWEMQGNSLVLVYGFSFDYGLPKCMSLPKKQIKS